METLSFPRYNVAEIVIHIRNKILTGADGKNLTKNDLYPNPKVKGGYVCMWIMVFKKKVSYQVYSVARKGYALLFDGDHFHRERISHLA